MNRFSKPFIFVALIFGIAVAHQVHRVYFSKKSETPVMFNEAGIQMPLAEKENFPIYSRCKNPKVGAIRWQGSVLAHEDFARAFDLSKDPDRLVAKQLQFLSGYFNYGTPDGFPFRVFLLKNRKLEIKKISKVNYGKNFDFDFVYDAKDRYPETFQENRKINAQDGALAVDYLAEQDVVVCDSKEELKKISLSLPHDPYLAFWNVPESKRETLAFKKRKTRTNPCAYREMADLRMPSMYWYVWNPTAHGKSADGVPFDCREILKPGTDYSSLSADFVSREEPKREVSFEALSKLDRWKVSVVYGLVSQQASRKSLDDALAHFRSKGVLDLAREIGSKRFEKAEFLTQDSAVWAFLYVLNALSAVADIEEPVIQDKETHLTIDLKAKLKQSGKSVDFFIYFGSTDVPQGKARHWDFLADAFPSSDIVFYIGHAGMGENLNFEAFRKTLDVSEAEFEKYFAKKPFQILGIVSCWGNMYYGEEYMKLRSGEGRTSDLFITAQDGYPFYTPVSFLHYLDLKVAGRPVSLEKALAFGIEKEEMALYRRSGVP